MALIATVIWVIGAPRLVATEGLSPVSVAPLQSAVDLLTAFLSGGSAVLLLAGIFCGRGHRAPRSVR